MHAKMTRDRKKSFIATTEKTIEDLERDIARMRSILNIAADDEEQDVVPTSVGTEGVGPTTKQTKRKVSVISPELTALPSPPEENSSSLKAVSRDRDEMTSPNHHKRVCHGFSLDG